VDKQQHVPIRANATGQMGGELTVEALCLNRQTLRHAKVIARVGLAPRWALHLPRLVAGRHGNQLEREVSGGLGRVVGGRAFLVAASRGSD